MTNDLEDEAASDNVFQAKHRAEAARLSNVMKQTAGCRFIAAHRLEARDISLTRLTAFTSAYVIVLTVLPYFLKTDEHATDLINLATVGCAIVVLISSLLQYSARDPVSAEQHHRAGLEINEIRRELEIKIDALNQQEVLRFSKEYDRILQKFSLNHDEIDFKKYQLSRPNEFPWIGKFERARIWGALWASKYVPSLTLIVLSVMVLTAIGMSVAIYLKAEPPKTEPPATAVVRPEQKVSDPVERR